MKREDKIVARMHNEEIDATLKLVRKPLTRKTYLLARKFYTFHKERLEKLEYKGIILSFPRKHIVKKEVPDDQEVA